MTQRLAGKTALITAAGQGIGRASALLFAAEGATVIATDRDAATLAGLDGIECRALDVTDPTAILALRDAIGPVDILFNVAGVVQGGTILDRSGYAPAAKLLADGDRTGGATVETQIGQRIACDEERRGALPGQPGDQALAALGEPDREARLAAQPLDDAARDSTRLLRVGAAEV